MASECQMAWCLLGKRETYSAHAYSIPLQNLRATDSTMITAPPVLFSLLQSQSVAWVATSGPLALFGVYYGFLTTLPFGFSQLVSLRACLLEEQDKRPSHWPKLTLFGESIPDALLWSLSGLMVAQVALFISAYCPPLYAIWVRPHALSLLFLPYAWIYLYRIAKFERLFRPDTRMWYEQLSKVFVDSFLFQVLNPVLLPSPVLARLMSLFLFRYSQMPLFILGGIVGWLAGHATFALCSYLLLLRLQYDAPNVYRVTQRLVHEPFPRIVLAFCLVLLGRAPLPLVTSLVSNEHDDTNENGSNLQRREDQSLLPFSKRWPDAWFDHHLWKRPTRSLREFIDPAIQTKRSLKSYPFHKKHFSQHFFEAVISDGKRRLSYTYPQGLVTLRKPLEELVRTQEFYQDTETNLYKNWAHTHARHFEQLNQSVSRRMDALDQGADIEQVIEKKLSSWTEKERSVGKVEDPRLAQSLRGRALVTGSNWILFERKAAFATNLKEHFPAPSQGALTNWILNRDATMPAADDTPSIGKIALTEMLQPERQQNELAFEDASIKFGAGLTPDSALKQMPLWASDVKLINRDYLTSGDPQIYVDKRVARPTKEKQRAVKSFFVRDHYKGSMRSRRRKAMLCNLVQRQPHAPFWLRVQQPEIEETISETENLNNTTGGVREALRNRRIQSYNNVFIHIMRGPSLLIQLFLRRFVRQPLFIVLKTLGRWLLFQPSEWNQDWSQWGQETHVYCPYNDQISSKTLPDRWLFWGLQIKILSPFRLRPWHRSTLPVSATIALPQSSYLDIIGQERVLPLGDIKVLPSLWRPIIKAIPLWLQQPSSSPWGLWRQGVYFLLQRLFKFQNFNSKQTLTSEVDISLRSPEGSVINENASSNDLEQTVANIPEQPLTAREQKPIKKEKTKELAKKNTFAIAEYVQIEAKSEEARQKLIQFDSWMSRLHATQSFAKGSAFKVKSHSTTTRIESLPTKALWKQRWRIQANSNPFHFQLRFLSDESHRSIQYRINQFKEALLYTRRRQTLLNRQIKRLASQNWFHARGPRSVIKRETFRGWKPFSRWVKTQKQRLHLSWQQWIERPIHLIGWQAMHIDLSWEHLWQVLFKRWKVPFAKQNEPNKTLSQAYILHKIWEAKTKKQPGVTQLINTWSAKGILRSSFEHVLTVQDVLNLSNPQALGLSTWHEWLDSLYHHMPPARVWQSLSPQHWTLKHPLLLSSSSETTESLPVTISPLLDPLFMEAKHASMRLRFFALSRAYTDLFSLEKTHFEQEEPLLNGSIAKLGNASSGRSTLAIIAKEKDRSKTKFGKQRFWRLIDNALITASYRQRKLERGYLSLEVVNIAYNLAEEARLWRDIVELKREYFVEGDLDTIAKRRKQIAKLKTLPYLTRGGPLRFNMVEDTRLFQNMAGMLLRFMQKQEAEPADLSVSQETSLSKTALEKTLWCTAPLTPEEILLPTQIRTFRVLDGLELTASLKDLQNRGESSQLAHADVLVNGKEQGASMTNGGEIKQEVEESRVIKRFLWPSHRLEDLACMNRFWLGTANQSRLSALRLRMYPSIPST